MKMSENYHQNFDAFFDRVSENLRLNFAIRDYVQKQIVEKYRLLSLFVPMPCHIHPQTHTHTQKKKKTRKEGKNR